MISELRNTGFLVKLDGDEIVYRFTGDTPPGRDKLHELLSQLRANKAAAIEVLLRENATGTPQKDIVNEFFTTGQRLNWPRVGYRRGHTLMAGEENWRKFAVRHDMAWIGEVLSRLREIAKLHEVQTNDHR